MSLGRPRIWLALGTLAWRLRLWRSGRAIIRIARLPLARAQFELVPRSGRMLLDQALLQDVWSILLSVQGPAPAPDVLSPLLAELYAGLSVHVVALDIDADAAADRVSEREGGLSRFDGLPRESVAALLSKAGPMTSALAEAARRSGLKVDTIDAAGTVGEVVGAALAVFGCTIERPR